MLLFAVVLFCYLLLERTQKEDYITGLSRMKRGRDIFGGQLMGLEYYRKVLRICEETTEIQNRMFTRKSKHCSKEKESRFFVVREAKSEGQNCSREFSENNRKTLQALKSTQRVDIVKEVEI